MGRHFYRDPIFLEKSGCGFFQKNADRSKNEKRIPFFPERFPIAIMIAIVQ
jgi:hypothetical protein